MHRAELFSRLNLYDPPWAELLTINQAINTIAHQADCVSVYGITCKFHV